MKKDTAQMLKELEGYSDFKSFYETNSNNFITGTLSDYLNDLLTLHNIKKTDAIKKSELSEIYAYQIFSGVRVPERKKLLSLAIGMELSLPEVQKLMKCSGYATLYAKNEFDCIIIYGIYKKLSVVDINYILFEHGLDTLG